MADFKEIEQSHRERWVAVEKAGVAMVELKPAHRILPMLRRVFSEADAVAGRERGKVFEIDRRKRSR